MAQIELQRFRLNRAGLSESMANRVNQSYQRYRGNIERAFNMSGGRATSAFINGRYQQVRQTQVARSTYMGLSNG
uniref:Uncharacterized protein n=1 Tax=Siphoviridae sp. ctlHU7 TaxID=2827588 RepID=A0A8S5LIM9_9CAUD|nr:MAG TPA: hypothetical protein [Siphoviridae sp. ctlHU7]